MGRNGTCIIPKYLYYFNMIHGFPVPVVHALLHNVFGPFPSFCLRPLRDSGNTPAGSIITQAGRRAIAAQATHLIPHSTMGRRYKSVLKHLGLYTFEDYKNFALTYGKYVMRDTLPPLLRSMYNNLTTAIRHYLTFDSSDFTPEAREGAYLALLEYAEAVELLGPAGHSLLTPSLDVLLCRCGQQGGWAGLGCYRVEIAKPHTQKEHP
jgi:hypothetical protein